MQESDALAWMNFKALEIFNDGDISDLSPAVFHNPEVRSVTINSGEDGAFELKPVSTGTIRMPNYEVEANNGVGLWRGVWGYVAANRAHKNSAVFTYTLSLLINDGLNQLAQEGFSNKSHTFTIKRTNGLSFRDLDNYAGYEIRILAEKRKD